MKHYRLLEKKKNKSGKFTPKHMNIYLDKNNCDARDATVGLVLPDILEKYFRH